MERDYFRNRWKVDKIYGKLVGTVFVTAKSGIEQAHELLHDEYNKLV